MSEIKNITEKLLKFRDERNWKQFHNAKDLALALSIEAAELNELFLWKKAEDADVNKVKNELADIFAYAFQLAATYDFDVQEIVESKMAENALKYPVDKAKGNANKYTDL